MYNIDYNDPEVMRQMKRRHRRGKLIGGFFLVVLGVLFMAREMGAMLPEWLFTWKTLLIGIGLAGAIKNAFRPGGWIIALLVGFGFLITDIYPDLAFRPYLWPVVLIIVGLIVMLKPYRHRDRHWKHWHDRYAEKKKMQQHEAFTSEDYLESTTVFGGVKKNIITKNFKGGEVTNVIGGAEINLSQADFEGTVTLEITQVMGGTRLIVPSHWEIKSAVTAVLGSVEDKRLPAPAGAGLVNKVLVLEGVAVLGGIEIRSV